MMTTAIDDDDRTDGKGSGSAPADTGEDEGSTAKEGQDGHLKDDQKPTTK
jgi:hypothetical protein